MEKNRQSRWSVSKQQPLVTFIQAQLDAAPSKKEIRRILESNGCKVNGRFERFGSAWVERGDVVEFTYQQRVKKSFITLFENEHCLIVDKPVNWVCDEANCRRTFGSLIFLAHRLDKDTTGALLLAKGNEAKEALRDLFAERSMEKEYLALVDGVPRSSQGVIENFLMKKRSLEGQTVWGSAPSGDYAKTEWSLTKSGVSASLILCKPYTGRTHQIRVHMAEMGHPILIDRQYATTFRSRIFASRPLLHASRLSFIFRGEAIDIQAPLPEDFIKGMKDVKIDLSL